MFKPDNDYDDDIMEAEDNYINNIDACLLGNFMFYEDEYFENPKDEYYNEYDEEFSSD